MQKPSVLLEKVSDDAHLQKVPDENDEGAAEESEHGGHQSLEGGDRLDEHLRKEVVELRGEIAGQGAVQKRSEAAAHYKAEHCRWMNGSSEPTNRASTRERLC